MKRENFRKIYFTLERSRRIRIRILPLKACRWDPQHLQVHPDNRKASLYFCKSGANETASQVPFWAPQIPFLESARKETLRRVASTASTGNLAKKKIWRPSLLSKWGNKTSQAPHWTPQNSCPSILAKTFPKIHSYRIIARGTKIFTSLLKWGDESPPRSSLKPADSSSHSIRPLEFLSFNKSFWTKWKLLHSRIYVRGGAPKG